MNINFKSLKCSEVEVLAITLTEDKLTTPNENINKVISSYKERGAFEGKEGQLVSFTRDLEGALQNVIILGLGKEVNLNAEVIRKIAGKAVRTVKELKGKTLALRLPETDKLSLTEMAKAAAYGAKLGDYDFDKYKTDKKETAEITVSVNAHGINEEQVSEGRIAVEESVIIADAVIIARDLVNEPSNVIYPETLANEAVKVGAESGFEVEVLNQDKILELKMEAFYNVAKASVNEPKLIVMRYFGDNDNRDERLGLVGKGLTYDSGGYSIKPSTGMETMKSDMGGAASVIGAMSAIAKKKLKINVVAVVAACENLINGNGYKPGEIIGSMAGKTIEVINTDAEGRLTLADAVHYIIEKENANKVVDVATLTGAALVALGETTTAVVTNNSDFYKELLAAASETGEKFWELPSFDDYKKLIKSEIADLKNTGGRYGGTITAGLFIGEFVQDKPWLHLDIAGTSWASSKNDYCIKGGTGAPVATLYQLVKNMVK